MDRHPGGPTPAEQVVAAAAEFDHERGWLGRPAWVEIDLDAVSSNAGSMKRRVGDGVEVMAVVKADAYGLGAVEVAEAALRGGATWLGVACADEGLQLRLAGFRCPILILGPPAISEIPKIIGAGMVITVHRIELAEALSRCAAEAGIEAAVHLKLDTGLNRFGHEPEGFVQLAVAVARLPSLRLEGLCTHFAVADQPEHPFTRQQIALLDAAVRQLAGAGIRFRVIHAAGSAGAIEFSSARYNMVRMGITLSGHYPSAHVDGTIGLRAAVTIKARVMRRWLVEPGAGIGYGRSYVAREPRLAALLPIGYADGYPRAASNKSYVLLGGRRCPVVGRISMDQLTVDITEAAEVREGDEAVLAGAQGGGRVTLDEVAAAAGTISYEILTHLGRRLPRLYFRHGLPVRARTLLGDQAL